MLKHTFRTDFTPMVPKFLPAQCNLFTPKRLPQRTQYQFTTTTKTGYVLNNIYPQEMKNILGSVTNPMYSSISGELGKSVFRHLGFHCTILRVLKSPESSNLGICLIQSFKPTEFNKKIYFRLN